MYKPDFLLLLFNLSSYSNPSNPSNSSNPRTSRTPQAPKVLKYIYEQPEFDDYEMFSLLWSLVFGDIGLSMISIKYSRFSKSSFIILILLAFMALL